MFFPKIEQSWHIFLQNTNGSWQGFTNSGGSYYQNSISVKFWFCMTSYFYQHFHETLLHCDSKHLFPFLLSLLIFHRKPRRFYTYIHELLECNIASHTFFCTQIGYRYNNHLGYLLYKQEPLVDVSWSFCTSYSLSSECELQKEFLIMVTDIFNSGCFFFSTTTIVNEVESF